MTASSMGGPSTGGPPSAPGGEAPAFRGRYSLEALRESRGVLAGLGLAFSAVVAGIIYLIILTFTGTFTNIVTIRAELPAGSNAVPIGAAVEYRNVTVGKLGSETPGPNGRVAVQLLIYPRNLPLIPAGVQAQVSPLSIFGNQYVDLVASTAVAPGHLRTGQFVAAYTGSPSTSLQGTVTQLYDLLNAVHPAQLDTALTAFATALNGQGPALGRALTGSASYLGQAVVPNLPTVSSDLNLVDPAANEVNKAAPDVLSTLSNTTVTAQTITTQERALHDLLSAGGTSIGRFGGVLEKVQATLPALINESAPLLSDITQSPTELSQTLSGLTQFASAVAAAETQGPFLSVTANLPVANISAGVNAALGYDNPASVTEALGSAVNPATYSAANCPEYPGTVNPYCGTGGSPAGQPVSAASEPSPAGSPAPAAPPRGESAHGAPTQGASNQADAGYLDAAMIGTAAEDPYAAQVNAVQAIAASLNGGRPPASPGLATLVLLPLLSSIAHG